MEKYRKIVLVVTVVVVSLVMCSVVVIDGYSELRQVYPIWNNPGRTSGSIVSFDEYPAVRGSKLRRLFYVTYHTGEGVDTLTSNFDLEFNKQYEVGDTVSVLYDRKNPSNARVDAFSEVFLPAISFGCFGVLGIFLFLFGVRRMRLLLRGGQ